MQMRRGEACMQINAKDTGVLLLQTIQSESDCKDHRTLSSAT